MEGLAGLEANSLPGHFSPDPLSGQSVLSGRDFAEFEEGFFDSEEEQEEKQVPVVASNPKTELQFPEPQVFFAGVPQMGATEIVMKSTDLEKEEKDAKAAKAEPKAAKAAKAEAKAAKAEAKAAKAAAKAAKKAAAKKPAAKKPAAKKPAVKKTTASRKRAAQSVPGLEPAKKKSKEEEPASEAEQQLLDFLKEKFVSREKYDLALKGTVSQEEYEVVQKELEEHKERFDLMKNMFS